jgi:hypothetical protein
VGTTEELFGVQTEAEPANPPVTETEKKEPEATQTETVTEEHKELEVSQEQAQEVKTYTPEELANLIASDEEIDTSRLSIEGQALMRSFQRGLTPKLQQIAELRKQLESDLRQKEMPKTKTIADYFEDDPEGTLVWIDQQIMQKKTLAMQHKTQADYDSALTAMSEASDWESVKSTLVAKSLFAQTKVNSEERKLRKALESFPDYESKKEMAIKFLLKENPEFTEEEAREVIDASKGKSSIKLAKLISRLADKSATIPNSDSKIVKKAPDALGRPGSSQPSAKKEEFDYQKEFELAKSTNNWDKILKYKGAI